MRFYWLILGILATWRVTHLLHAEDGPWDLLVRFRQLFGRGFFGSLLDCFYCLSLWIALPAAWLLGEGWKERLWLWPALSAGAILLEQATTHRNAPLVAPYFEEGESSDELLRKK
jgi:hypothetical protein